MRRHADTVLPLLLLLAATPPATAAELPVRSVVLSNAGLAQIERKASFLKILGSYPAAVA